MRSFENEGESAELEPETGVEGRTLYAEGKTTEKWGWKILIKKKGRMTKGTEGSCTTQENMNSRAISNGSRCVTPPLEFASFRSVTQPE